MEEPILNQVATNTFNPNSFSLVVNYEEKLEEKVRRGGYGIVHPAFVSQNSGTTRTGTMTLNGGHLVRMSFMMDTQAAEHMLEEMGLRPGDAHELCDFGGTFPNVQRTFIVVALGGSRWQLPGIGDCIAIIDAHADVRVLGLTNYSRGNWYGCYALAFPK